MAKKKRKIMCASCDRMRAREEAELWYASRRINRKITADEKALIWVASFFAVAAIIAISYYFLH